MTFITLTSTEDRAISIDVEKIAAVTSYRSGTRVSFATGWTLEVRESTKAVWELMHEAAQAEREAAMMIDNIDLVPGYQSPLPNDFDPDAYVALVNEAGDEAVKSIRAAADELFARLKGLEPIAVDLVPLTKRLAELEELVLAGATAEQPSEPAPEQKPAEEQKAADTGKTKSTKA
jgi:hypothetical protein